jgi:hypothetical protein
MMEFLWLVGGRIKQAMPGESKSPLCEDGPEVSGCGAQANRAIQKNKAVSAV